MQKKIITIIAILTLALCVVGCSASNSAAKSSMSAGAAQSSVSNSKTEAQKAFDDTMIGTSIFSDSVRNDKTGNWRSYVYQSDKNAQDIALDYYKAYFASDSEVHALENLGLKTSASVNAGDGLIYVTVYDYVQGEEHDATAMFTGQKLGQYIITISTGEIEKVA